ncbi:synaptonemal complex central element protein 1-like isoform X7 [Equus quagga]|uniref:synaptonemal complex central element protein 1-like isoform X7 n=1 Tax=Equus quagga TaxID=89248 RepID=UPI001EE1A600|nr:synaptonemal complex central element protein 1-like isoform X7 [Equus quagga]
MLQGAPVQASRWKMAGKVEPLKVEPLEVAEESEEAEGQTRSSKKTEDLLAMVKKLQKEGSLEPQIEDLIHRINELQQAKKKSSEELGEAQALWEALHRELDSLNGEKVHLEEVLSKKQEALRILQLHCQSKESEAQRKHTLQDCTDQISIHSSHMAESQKQRKPGLHVEEQLEDLMGQHKDLWEFHMLEQRLTWEIRALRSSKEQLLTEGCRRSWRKSGGTSPPKPTAPQREGPATERWSPGVEARRWGVPGGPLRGMCGELGARGAVGRGQGPGSHQGAPDPRPAA